MEICYNKWQYIVILVIYISFEVTSLLSRVERIRSDVVAKITMVDAKNVEPSHYCHARLKLYR